MARPESDISTELTKDKDEHHRMLFRSRWKTKIHHGGSRRRQHPEHDRVLVSEPDPFGQSRCHVYPGMPRSPNSSI